MHGRDPYWLLHRLLTLPRSDGDLLSLTGGQIRFVAPPSSGGGPSVEAGDGLSRTGVTLSLNVLAALGTRLASNAVAIQLGLDPALELHTSGIRWLAASGGGLQRTSAGARVLLRDATLAVDSSGLGAVGVPLGFAIEGVSTHGVTASALDALVAGSSSNADALHTHTFPAGEIITAGGGLTKTGTTLDANVSTPLGTGLQGNALAVVLATAAGLELASGGLRVLLTPAGGLQVDVTGVSVKTDATLGAGAPGLTVLGVPSLFKIAGVSTLGSVSAANLNTLTSSASNDADGLHTHASLATVAGAGLSKAGTTLSANVSATLSTQISGNNVGVLTHATGGLAHTGAGLALMLAGSSGLQTTVAGVSVLLPASSGLTLGVTGLSANVADAQGTQISSNTIGIKLASSTPGLQLTASGLSALLDGATLIASALGLSVAGVPSLWQVDGVATSANVTAANLNTLTAGASSDADALHTHAGLVTTASASGGLTKSGSAFSANVAAASGTFISSNTIGVKLATVSGLNLAAGGLSILPNGSTLSVGASGISVAGVPSLWQVNGVATSANVTAAALNSLTSGSLIAGQHSHPLAGSLGGSTGAATVVRLDGASGKVPAANYIEFDAAATAGLSQVQNTTAAGLHMYIQAQASTFGAGGEARIMGGQGNTTSAASDGAVKFQTRNGAVTLLTIDPPTAKMTLAAGYVAALPTVQVTECRVINQAGAPATPTGEYVLYASSGALKGKGTSGTVTTIGTAEPHCPTCERDFALEWENGSEHLAVCVPCMLDQLARAGLDVGKFAFLNTLAS